MGGSMGFIRFILVALLIICILAGVVLWLGRVSFTESFLSKKLKTEVTLEDISFGFGKITLKNLRLTNPASSKVPYAFEAGAITIQLSPSELFKKETHIHRIKIQDPHLSIELYNSSGNDNNWAPILSQVPSKPHSSSHSYIIDRLSIVNLRVDIIRNGGKKISLPSIPYLEFQSITKNNLPELFRHIFIKLLESIPSKYNLNTLLDTLTSSPDNPSTYDSVKNTLKEGANALKQKVEEATDYLQNLFAK